MSASLFNVLELLCIFLISHCWAMRVCPSYNSSDFIKKDETAKTMDFGDCSFMKSLCNYTQACTNGSAGNWTIMNGSAGCPGNSGDHDSFSTMMSPLLKLDQNTSLDFNYTQQQPGKLTVFTITNTTITQVFPERQEDGSFHGLLFIGPSTVKIGFRAQKPEAGHSVTLRNVKLQVVSYTLTSKVVTTRVTSPPYKKTSTLLSTQAEVVTTRVTSPPYNKTATLLSTQAGYIQDNTEAAEDKGGSNAAVVAGVIVPVIVMAAAVVVSVFIWRRRKQRLHGTPKGVAKQADMRSTSPFVPRNYLTSKSSANSYENSMNAKSESARGALDTSSNHYRIPRKGQPATCHTAANTESLPPLARDPPSAGDDDDHNHNILEEYSTAAAPQTATSVYSYARGEEPSPSKSNCLDADYNRIGSPEARSRVRSEAGSDAVEDEYTYIASTDAVVGVRSQAAASRPTGWNGHPGQNATASEGDSSCDQHTALDCEDGYSVLSAGNKQIQAFNDQRSEGAEKAYGRLASNVHGDYDRIRRKDRDDVLGNDYDHVSGHTEGDYDEMRLTDKEKIIGNDYDHLV